MEPMFGSDGFVLHDGKPIPIPVEVLSSFVEGDKLFVSSDGGLLHVPRAIDELVSDAVARAVGAFSEMRHVEDESITRFFGLARTLLADEGVQARVLRVNDDDCHRAAEAGRSITRLRMDRRMLDGMLESLEMWQHHPILRQKKVEEIDHEGWTATKYHTPLGVVGFVFEGRPNVVIDACGVFVTGNTCVFRIGRDARATARALIEMVIAPAMRNVGLPEESLVLIESDEHASGWSLFAQRELGLAVARGSGKAVQDLGSVARQCGVPVSLHGRGGAWFILGESADAQWLSAVLTNSLDRKVCNTANVVCVPESRAAELFPIIVRSVQAAADSRNALGRIHLVEGSETPLGSEGVEIDLVGRETLATEWEWENDPEITLCIVDSFATAVELFNQYSPRLAASVITEDPEERRFAWNALRCPFVGNGISRWVDGQFAFERPELGLSNWEAGIPLGRGAILSGSDISAVRYLAHQTDRVIRR